MFPSAIEDVQYFFDIVFYRPETWSATLIILAIQVKFFYHFFSYFRRLLLFQQRSSAFIVSEAEEMLSMRRFYKLQYKMVLKKILYIVLSSLDQHYCMVIYI